MFSFLKPKSKVEDLEKNNKDILITAILIECAKSDYDFSEEEILKIKNILREKLKIDDGQLDKVFTTALENSNDSVEIYSLTKEIRECFEQDEIVKLYESMWEIVLVDGLVDDFEASLMRQFVGLFHLTPQEAVDAKNNAIKKINNP